MKVCGVAVAMPPGYSRAPTPTIDQSVNTGTVPVLPWAAHPARISRLSQPSADQAGTGRSRRSSPSAGKPRTWRRAAAGFV